MATLKNRRSDLRSKYKLVFEISIIISLLFLIASFKYFPYIEKKGRIVESQQDLFIVEEIAQTIQDQTPPPPPPKPQVVIQVPTEEILEDVEIFSTELNLNENVAPPPPPPGDDKRVKKVIESEPHYFVAVEQMPEPIGGMQAIHDKIIYPDIAKRAGIQGIVYILAYLNEEGVVDKTEVIKGIGGGCDEAASFAVRNTRFIPGKQRGKPVRVKITVPVRFVLKD